MAKKTQPVSPHELNFNAIEACYRSIENNRSALFAACGTEAQRDEFFAIYNAARDTYWMAIAKRLEDNHVFIKDLRADLKKATTKVKKDLRNVQDIAATLKLLAETVRLAASLAAAAII